MSVVREHFYLKGINITSCFEGLIPPASALQQCRSDRFGCAIVEVVNDRFHGLAPFSGGIFFLKSVPYDVPFCERLANGGAVVLIGGRVVTGSWVEGSGFVIVVRQFHERVVHAHGNRVVGGSHRAQPAAGSGSCEGEYGFKLAVFGEVKCSRHVDGGSRGVDGVGSLTGRSQTVRNPVGILHQKWGEVDKDPTVLFSGHFKPEKDRLRKGFIHRFFLQRHAGGSPVPKIGLNHHHFWPDTLETDDSGVAQLASIQTDVVGSYPGCECIYVKKRFIKPVDFQPDFVGGFITPEGKKTFKPLHTGGFFSNGRVDVPS